MSEVLSNTPNTDEPFAKDRNENELNPDGTPPSEEYTDGWDDADTINEHIFCPNPEL